MLLETTADTDAVWLELWSDEPETSDGLALLYEEGRPAALAPIPLCACGERGCGNAGSQLALEVASEDVPPLAEGLAELPWRFIDPTRRPRWVPDDGLPSFAGR
jgi:hypothetical protein